MPYGVILAAGVVSGLALWCSNGVLERVTQDDRIVRVALLPPLWVALACCVVAIGAIGALVHLVSRVGQRHAPAALPDASLADLCLPLFATATLVTPYLPHLADWFPALTLLAGPFKGVVWTVVVVLVARAALLRAGASVTPRLSRRVSAMLVFLAGLALYQQRHRGSSRRRSSPAATSPTTSSSPRASGVTAIYESRTTTVAATPSSTSTCR